MLRFDAATVMRAPAQIPTAIRRMIASRYGVFAVLTAATRISIPYDMPDAASGS